MNTQGEGLRRWMVLQGLTSNVDQSKSTAFHFSFESKIKSPEKYKKNWLISFLKEFAIHRKSPSLSQR
jgi:hypothetical protein